MVHREVVAASTLPVRPPLALPALVAGTLANLAPGMTMCLSLPAVLAATGAGAPWAFALAACAMLAAANTMAEFNRALSSAGSFVTYVGRGFGVYSPRAGATLGALCFYILLLSFPLTQAAGLAFLGWWVAGLLGWTGQVAWLGAALLAVAAGTPLLLRGLAVGHRGALALFLIEASALLLLAGAVALHSPGGLDRPLRAEAVQGLGSLPGLPFALAMFCYLGWEHAGSLAEETADPRRTVPRAVLLAVLLVCLLYTGVAWAAAAGLPSGGTDASAAGANPLLALARRHLGAGAWLVGLVGCTSPLACLLAEVAAQARLLAHGAREGLLPAPVAAVRPSTGVPVVAVGLYVALSAALCAVPALLGAPPVLICTVEAGVGTVPILLVYLLAGLALPLYMWRACRDRFRPVRHLLVPAAGGCALLYGSVAFLRPDQPAPGNLFWLETSALLGCCVTCAAVALGRGPAAMGRIRCISAGNVLGLGGGEWVLAPAEGSGDVA